MSPFTVIAFNVSAAAAPVFSLIRLLALAVLAVSAFEVIFTVSTFSMMKLPPFCIPSVLVFGSRTKFSVSSVPVVASFTFRVTSLAIFLPSIVIVEPLCIFSIVASPVVRSPLPL